MLLGPKSPSPVSAQPGVRWSYVNLVKAAVAFWHVVRGKRAVLDADWTPRMGVFWAGIKRSCVHGSVEKSPQLLSDVRALWPAQSHVPPAFVKRQVVWTSCHDVRL